MIALKNTYLNYPLLREPEPVLNTMIVVFLLQSAMIIWRYKANENKKKKKWIIGVVIDQE